MGLGFAFSSLLIHVLRFYKLRPDKCMLKLFCMVGCIENFNRQFGLKLTHHDINNIYIYIVRLNLINHLIGFIPCQICL